MHVQEEYVRFHTKMLQGEKNNQKSTAQSQEGAKTAALCMFQIQVSIRHMMQLEHPGVSRQGWRIGRIIQKSCN